ncbi:hypothetical protein K1719_024092 [Acacia pycnantha]|nr:hypothetical protein K1719_024092 [Acacia pycnantha]
MFVCPPSPRTLIDRAAAAEAPDLISGRRELGKNVVPKPLRHTLFGVETITHWFKPKNHGAEEVVKFTKQWANTVAKVNGSKPQSRLRKDEAVVPAGGGGLRILR